MIDQCQECQKKPAVAIVLIAEPMKLRARAMCKDCSGYLPKGGEVRELSTVATVAMPIPAAILKMARGKSDPSNDQGDGRRDGSPNQQGG